MTFSNIKEIIFLVDEPYLQSILGKAYTNPWFGMLFRSNTKDLYSEDLLKINRWFNTLSDNNVQVEKKLEKLLNEPYRIRGLNVGFITTMLYITNKNDFLIWFKVLHNGLRLIYPEFEYYTGKSKQYLLFNEKAKKFALEYSFEHTELDWIFSTGIPAIIKGGKRMTIKTGSL
ncbi:MAG: hypothetical protein IPN68_13985 [Bacteroidetes bacterium]|nr:hypothetical protein [Bacteroidota bacterium]